MTTCFITDGGLQLGMGHVQQSTTLARELARHVKITFLTKSGPAVAGFIRAAGFPVTELTSDDEIAEHLAALDPEIVLFDKIDVDERLARTIRSSLRAGLVIFTNLTDANRHADLTVTADIGSRLKNVARRDHVTGAWSLNGPKYWVLRPEFHEHKLKGKRAPRERPPSSILLIFGGSDPANLTPLVLSELLSLPRAFRIDVVLGPHFPKGEDIERIVASNSSRTALNVHRNIKNVAELMYSTDLVLASPGLSVFEALCVGTPVIAMPQDTLQRDAYFGLMRMLERTQVDQLGGMIERADFTFPRDREIVEMAIGEGLPELLERILATRRRSPQ